MTYCLENTENKNDIFLLVSSQTFWYICSWTSLWKEMLMQLYWSPKNPKKKTTEVMTVDKDNESCQES